jgi:uncharacterized membrane protein YphA (DoxX/SURF4 family)
MDSLSEKRPRISWLTHPNTALIGRVILGCVFVYASLDKIRHPNLFAEIVYNYQLLPDAAVNLLAIWLPWLELVSGVLLLVGIWIQGSILLLSGLMLIFLSAMGINLARGLDISCGCFTTQSSDPMTILTLFRDSLFLFLAFYLFWLYQIRGLDDRFTLVRVLQRR